MYLYCILPIQYKYVTEALLKQNAWKCPIGFHVWRKKSKKYFRGIKEKRNPAYRGSVPKLSRKWSKVPGNNGSGVKTRQVIWQLQKIKTSYTVGFLRRGIRQRTIDKYTHNFLRFTLNTLLLNKLSWFISTLLYNCITMIYLVIYLHLPEIKRSHLFISKTNSGYRCG